MPNKEGNTSSRKRRTISDTLTPIIEQFELKGSRVVVIDDLRTYRPNASDAVIRRIAHELVQGG